MSAPLAPSKSNRPFKTYYALVEPRHLVTWAASAMKNSYSPYSGRKEGVLLRTDNGDITVGTNVELINWDGLSAIEVAIGSLFARQPWVDAQNRPESIADVVYALEDFDARDADTYVPDAHSLEWLRKFGSPDTMMHFSTPNENILVSRPLKDFLPHGPRMKALQAFFENAGDFSGFLHAAQEKPPELDTKIWHGLRKSRLHAFAPYSSYRVGVVAEAEYLAIPEDQMKELQIAFERAKSANGGLDVGATLLANLEQERRFFPGINVELSGNSALHAEGAAIGAMITSLGPKAKLANIHLQGGFKEGAHDCSYCGKCRQLLNEFSTDRTRHIVVAENQTLPSMTKAQLLPGTFAALG